jgi:acetyl-CoA C-acetyltransferase
MSRTPIIIAARRTPIGRVGRSLRSLTVEHLAAPVLQALLADTGLAPHAIDDVILGNAVGPGGNPARLAALTAGLPVTVPGLTVDRQCGSGLAAINLAARLIQAGAGDLYVAGGMESSSTAPWRIEKPTALHELPRFAHRARFAPEALGDPDMGIAAEQVAQVCQISRDRQDAYALRSHQRAIAAEQAGRFDAERVPLVLSSQTTIEQDDCPKATLSLERLAKLPPAFCADGTVTVGNACPVNDGAAAVVILAEETCRALGFRQGLRWVDGATAGVDPNVAGLGPVAAAQALLRRHPSLTWPDVHHVEFNEAFAAQVLACLDHLDLPLDRVNPDGGAIALGHPYGASGAILITRLFTGLVRQRSPGQWRGMALIGVGGGMGIAALVERWDG